jgi:hypothetical protein
LPYPSNVPIDGAGLPSAQVEEENSRRINMCISWKAAAGFLLLENMICRSWELVKFSTRCGHRRYKSTGARLGEQKKVFFKPL